MLKIQVILGSTREGRRGIKVFNFFKEELGKRTDAKFEFIDLKDWNLPFFNSPHSPSSVETFDDPLVQKWADKISKADAYIFVTPEYNHGYSAVLKNALDLVYREWNHKAAAFIAYGGSAGGARAVEQLRQVVAELQMVSVREAILIPEVWNAFEQDQLKNAESYIKRLDSLIKQLLWWGEALKAAR